MLSEFDMETYFKARAAQGSREAGLALLDQLDAFDCNQGFINKQSYVGDDALVQEVLKGL